MLRTTLHAEGFDAEVGDESPPPGAMQMGVAENAPAAHAHTAFEQVNTPATAVTVGRDLGAAEHLERRHVDRHLVSRGNI